MTSPRSRPTVMLAPAAVLALALAGCGVSTDEPQSQESEPTATASSPTETVTVTESPSPSESASEPAPTSSAPAPTPTSSGPEGALLTGSELPGINDTLTWTEGRTAPAGADAFGLCAKFDLASIGATTVVQRDFTTDGATAAQQVADFADAQTAVRASKVLQSWHGSCRQRVQGRGVDVGAIQSVPVTRGTGSYYVVRYTRGGSGRFHAFGAVVDGTRMSLLRTDLVGQDRNHEPGQDPMELAVKAAAAKLGG